MNKLFIFLYFIIFINSAYADFDLNDLKIGDKEPINEPIDIYDPNKNSYPDPFSEDEILFSIDQSNYLEYADQLLTPGQIEMFKTYPETFKMHVYQSRRSCAVTQEVIKLTTQNAELTDEGEGIIGAVGSIPFPNPSEALHHVWNHILRYRGVNIYGSSPFYIINPDNSITYGAGEAIAINYWNPFVKNETSRNAYVQSYPSTKISRCFITCYESLTLKNTTTWVYSRNTTC